MVRWTAGILENSASRARERYSNEAWYKDSAYRQALFAHKAASLKKRKIRKRIASFSTKFHDTAYLKLAHFHYIMVPRKLMRSSEVPAFWGLLDETATLRVEAPEKQIPNITTGVLRAIARANTRDMMNARAISQSRSMLIG